MIWLRILAREDGRHFLRIGSGEVVASAAVSDLGLQELYSGAPIRIAGKLSDGGDVNLVEKFGGFVELAQADEAWRAMT